MPLTKVTSGVIAANAVVDSFGTQSITGDKIGLNAITGNTLASNIINANNIVNATITGDKIGIGQITSNLFAAGAVSSSNIFSGNSSVAVTSSNGNVSISVAGSETVRVVTDGNIGIGNNLPNARLEVQRTSGTTQAIGRFTAAVGGYTGTSLVAQNTLGPDSTYNLLSCITDSDGDAGGPYTEFYVRGDGLVFMDSGYGSAAAAYGVRAWVNFNGSNGSINGSGGVSSVTRNGTGDYTVAYSFTFPSNTYTLWGMGRRNSSAQRPVLLCMNNSFYENTTTGARFYTMLNDSATIEDPIQFWFGAIR